MTNQELIKLLKTNGYKRVTVETDSGESRTFYTYRRGLHIIATRNLSFHIIPVSQNFGLGRFATCVTKDGVSSQTGTDCPGIFFPRLLTFLQGKATEEKFI